MDGRTGHERMKKEEEEEEASHRSRQPNQPSQPILSRHAPRQEEEGGRAAPPLPLLRCCRRRHPALLERDVVEAQGPEGDAGVGTPGERVAVHLHALFPRGLQTLEGGDGGRWWWGMVGGGRTKGVGGWAE